MQTASSNCPTRKIENKKKSHTISSADPSASVRMKLRNGSIAWSKSILSSTGESKK